MSNIPVNLFRGGKYYFLIDSMGCGGAQRVIQNFTKIFSKQGIDTYLFTLSDELFYDIPEEVHYIPLTNIKNCYLLFFLIPILSLKFKFLLKKFGLKDGISFLENSNYIHILSKNNANISLRIHVNVFRGLGGKITKFLIKCLYPKAGKIIVNSRENKYDLAKFLNVPEDKIDVWYNPTDKEKIKELSEENLDYAFLDKIKNKKVFITTGRLCWQKHHEKIIETLNFYNSKDKDRVYLIVGDGEERQKLENLTKSFGLEDKIIFLGQQKNVFKYLKYADLFLYASEIEGFPNALLEAREMGLKIISSDFKTGAREVILGEDTDTIGKNIEYPIEGKYGILINFNDYLNQLLTQLLKI